MATKTKKQGTKTGAEKKKATTRTSSARAKKAVEVQEQAAVVQEEVKTPETEPVAAKPAESKPKDAAKPEPEVKPEPEAKPKPEAKSAAAEPRIKLVPSKDGSKLTEIVARPVNAGNPYKPMEATVLEVITEAPNIKTIRVTLDDPEVAKNFTFEPGQVGQLLCHQYPAFPEGVSAVLRHAGRRGDHCHPQPVQGRQGGCEGSSRPSIPLPAVEGQEALLHRRRHRHGPHQDHHAALP